MEEEESFFNNYNDNIPEPNPCKVCIYCICAPCICCCDCIKNACIENCKLVWFLILSFLLLVIGLVLFKLYYPSNMIVWIFAICIAGILPVTAFIISLVWCIVSGISRCYKRTRRNLISIENHSNDDVNFIL
jgi:hypothetical protein